MSQFVPGEIVRTFRTKKGNDVALRYPMWRDLARLNDYINALSMEDTYIRFSGEVISRAEEADVLANWFRDMELSNKVVLYKGEYIDEIQMCLKLGQNLEA